MGVFVITNGEGTYIRKDETTGKYVPIRSIKHAAQWDSIQKASSVLNNSISKNIRNGFAVQLIDTEHTVDKDNSGVRTSLCQRDIIDSEIQVWIDRISAITDLIANSDARNQELNDKLSEIDKEIVDIEHYIEFGKFNAYQGWQCFKMLQTALLQRRKYKNEMAVIEMISKCKIDEKSLQALSETVANIENKCYRPRALPELFRG